MKDNLAHSRFYRPCLLVGEPCRRAMAPKARENALMRDERLGWPSLQGSRGVVGSAGSAKPRGSSGPQPFIIAFGLPFPR